MTHYASTFSSLSSTNLAEKGLNPDYEDEKEKEDPGIFRFVVSAWIAVEQLLRFDAKFSGDLRR